MEGHPPEGAVVAREHTPASSTLEIPEADAAILAGRSYESAIRAHGNVVDRSFMPGHAARWTGADKGARFVSSTGRTETENPCISSEVISGAGPMMCLMLPALGEVTRQWARIDISRGVVEPRLFRMVSIFLSMS